MHDEALAVLPLEDVGEGMLEPERVYTLRVDGGLKEPDFTFRGRADTWRAGSASAAGERLVMRDSRLMKVSQVVRVDRRMTDEVMNVMVGLARTAIKRAVSEAIWGSAPQSGSGALLSGLPDFLVPSQDLVFDANQSFSANFDRLLARCRPGGDGLGAEADAIICSETAFINYMADREDRGLTVECCYSPLTGRLQRHHRGKPLLVGRVPEPAGTGTTVAYALSLIGPSRVRLAHRGGDPDELGTEAGCPPPSSGWTAPARPARPRWGGVWATTPPGPGAAVVRAHDRRPERLRLPWMTCFKA